MQIIKVLINSQDQKKIGCRNQAENLYHDDLVRVKLRATQSKPLAIERKRTVWIIEMCEIPEPKIFNAKPQMSAKFLVMQNV